MKKNFLKFLSSFSFIILFPIVTLAQVTFTQPTAVACTAAGIGGLLCKFQQILNSVVPVLIALGVVYFVWGVIQFMIAGGEEDKSKGRDKIIYGLIGFAVIIGLWGLVGIVVKTFGIGGSSAPTLAPLTITTGTTCALGANAKLQDLLCYVTRIINDSIIPLIFALAIAMFVWGVVKFFIINVDEEAKRAEGKQFMIWGIIALAVMLSVWGLVGVLKTTFGINVGQGILPQVRPPSN